MKRFVFSIPPNMDGDISSLAVLHKCSKADVVRMAIAQFVLVETVKEQEKSHKN